MKRLLILTRESMPANKAINDALAAAITDLALPWWAALLLLLAVLLILTVLFIWFRNRESSAPAQAINSPAPPRPSSQVIRPRVQKQDFSDNPNEGASELHQASGGLAGDDDDHTLLLPPQREGAPYLMEIKGKNPGRRHDISSDRVRIGRDPKRSQILLRDRTITGVQAIIVRQDEHYFLYPTLPGRAVLNGEKVVEATQLNHQDMIWMGNLQFQFIIPETTD